SGDSNLPSDVPDVCIQAGAPACPPAPSNDCTTRKFYKTIKNVRCEWGCKHWCCKPESEVLTECPETSPTNPYCIHTHVVRYTINGKQCPVYCGCVPDCRVLTC
ncbi:Hypothetical predicted protein, partial [Mytilus galloprovincialis]